MREIGVRELKQSLSETLRAVGRGEQVRVTVRGKAIADIVPARRRGRRSAVVEVDEELAEHAASLALDRGLRSLDALHLAAAMVLPGPDLTVATWDQRLHAAVVAEGLDVLPANLP